MNKLIIWAVLVISVTGCVYANSHRMNKVNLGMTKQEAIAAVGEPISISAKEGVEYLNYSFSESDGDAEWGRTSPYFIRLKNGKVDAYGRLGDFDSTKVPETKTTIDLNIDMQK